MKMGILAAAAALAVAVPATAANLLSNPGFENGNSDWNFAGYFVSGGVAGVFPNSGTSFASTGCVNSYCTVSQTVATTVGGKYTLDFDFNPGLNVSFGGASTLVSFGGVQVGPDIGLGPLGYVHYTYNVTATSTSSVLQFASFQNPAFTGVDDVSLVAGVPEPASWALMIVGFGLVGTAARRRTSAVAA